MTEIHSGAARKSGEGLVVTFYSYKGGTGRTMALANVAWILAASGYRILVADWDLESPGLHRFFHPFLAESIVRDGSGVIDLIRDYHWAAARASQQERTDNLIPRYARIEPYAVSLSWRFPAGGGIDYVSPGRQNTDYAATLGALDWDNFYESLSGGQFFDALRSDLKRRYDYVLIDSRTGLSDIADICTVHFPDVLVDCFTLSTQGIEGAAQVARMIRRRQDRGIRILPVPMRVDDGEQKKVDAGRKLAMRAFDGIPSGMSEAERRGYWAAVEVPYKPFYAFEETLAAFGEQPGAPGSLLSSYERIAARITDGAVTGLPLMDEQVRDRTLQLFTRQPPREIAIVVEMVAEDQIWAEWISGVLHGTGITVRERHLTETAQAEDNDGASRTLTVISASFRDRQRAQSTAPSRSDLALYVTPGRPLPEFSTAQAAFVSGIPGKEAAERLLRLLDIADRPESDLEGLAYYPGREPKIDRTPARNTRFTGRETDLRALREQLREHGRAVVLPVALHGLGGVGKTQIALEYVHRFKSDYDLVWWLDCSQPQFIDAALIDLAASIQDDLEMPIPVAVDVGEQADWVVRQLAQGKAVPRWLLVYDNAEDIDAVQRLLPEGGGHVLITSRNRAWSEQARALPIEVFTRAESVAHLHARVPSITGDEAERVAQILGDLPLAVALAGAWLAETGYAVSDYLAELQRQAPEALSVSQLADYPQPLSRAWDLSLNRLRDRSEAAMRLFELCAVMEARIALDLLYSPAMARVLVPFDAALSERMMIGRVVQEINRLALIKLDSPAQRVHVHRLVQAVVQGRMSAEQLAAARHDVQQVLAAARPRRDVDDPETWPRYRLIWPHLEPSQAMTSQDEPVRQLFVDRVRYLYIRHDLERGRELALQTEQAWAGMLAVGPEKTMETALRRQLLHLRFNLGNILRDLARYEEARTLDEAVLNEQRELLGHEHPHTLMTAGSLAADLRALGHYQDALKMDMETYPAWTELFGEDYAPTLSAANNLADSYRMTADFSAALRVDEETLERRRASLGPLHPRTLGSSSSVARDLVELGRYAEAVDLMESVRQAYAEVGDEPVAEWNAQVLLGIAMRGSGRPNDAAAYFMNALDGLARRFGEYSPEALACRLSYAGNLLTLRQAEIAERVIREVLARYHQDLGPSHPHTLVAQLNLADALRQIDQPAAALDAARTAAAGLTATLGENHAYALAAQVSVAVLLAERGELAAAEELETRTVGRLSKALGENHPDALRGRANLLLTRAEMGNEAAEGEREEVIKRLAEVLGTEHPHIGRLGEERRLMRTLDPQPF
jgi:MinD-like ATPase involved in chromosome partitioning or flagellar assembly/tetratricopeptide (TPR) repeat protein